MSWTVDLKNTGCQTSVDENDGVEIAVDKNIVEPWGQYYKIIFYVKKPNFYVNFQKSLKDFKSYLGKYLLLRKK